jgi:hypothetical protein
LKQYVVSPAKVIKNSVIREKNLITLNKGAYQGIVQDMGVISDKGVVGVVERTSDHFSTVISLLHKDLSINAALKNTKHFGSLIWDAKTIDRCTLVDLPKISNIQIGDTIVTGGMSSVFPAGIPIGQVSAYSIPNNSSFYKAEVRLFNDMSNLDQVYVIKNTLKRNRFHLKIKRMDSSGLLLLWRFIWVLLLQVLVFSGIEFFGVAQPMLLALFLFTYPTDSDYSLSIFLSFLLGLVADSFTDTPCPQCRSHDRGGLFKTFILAIGLWH